MKNMALFQKQSLKKSANESRFRNNRKMIQEEGYVTRIVRRFKEEKDYVIVEN